MRYGIWMNVRSSFLAFLTARFSNNVFAGFFLVSFFLFMPLLIWITPVIWIEPLDTHVAKFSPPNGRYSERTMLAAHSIPVLR